MNKYKELTIKGYHFPDDTITTEWKGLFNSYIMRQYLPILNTLNYPEAIKRLALIMTRREGYYPGARSYKTNNPGNIGNTDNGKNKGFNSLREGIVAQLEHLMKVSSGYGAYSFGRKKIKPYYSPEIAKNQKTYKGMSPYLPGYEFEYNGELGGFVKIYSTGARVSNGYLSDIVSYLRYKGFDVDENTTLKELTEM